jgi:hypothetical protein
VTTFLRKTIFEPSPRAALRLLLAVPFEVMRGYWSTIICAAESRMDFTMAVDRFKGELRSLFSSFRYGDANQLAFFPAELRMPIMQAGRSQTLLRITYDGVPRLVEPYALSFKWRKDGAGQEYLYVWDRTGGRSGPGRKSLFTGRSHRGRGDDSAAIGVGFSQQVVGRETMRWAPQKLTEREREAVLFRYYVVCG